MKFHHYKHDASQIRYSESKVVNRSLLQKAKLTLKNWKIATNVITVEIIQQVNLMVNTVLVVKLR